MTKDSLDKKVAYPGQHGSCGFMAGGYRCTIHTDAGGASHVQDSVSTHCKVSLAVGCLNSETQSYHSSSLL